MTKAALEGRTSALLTAFQGNIDAVSQAGADGLIFGSTRRALWMNPRTTGNSAQGRYHRKSIFGHHAIFLTHEAVTLPTILVVVAYMCATANLGSVLQCQPIAIIVMPVQHLDGRKVSVCTRGKINAVASDHYPITLLLARCICTAAASVKSQIVCLYGMGGLLFIRITIGLIIHV